MGFLLIIIFVPALGVAPTVSSAGFDSVQACNFAMEAVMRSKVLEAGQGSFSIGCFPRGGDPYGEPEGTPPAADPKQDRPAVKRERFY